MREKHSAIIYCCWNENSVVSTLSTCFPGHSINTIKPKGKNPSTGHNEEHHVPVPIIENHSKYMGGVDMSDQYLQYHSSLRHIIRYWKVLFYHMLDIAVVNAMALYNWAAMELGAKPVSENQFRDTLILQLIDKYRAPHPPSISGASAPVLSLLPDKCWVHHGSVLATQRKRRYCAHQRQVSLMNRRCTNCPFVPSLCPNCRKRLPCIVAQPSI